MKRKMAESVSMERKMAEMERKMAESVPEVHACTSCSKTFMHKRNLGRHKPLCVGAKGIPLTAGAEGIPLIESKRSLRGGRQGECAATANDRGAEA